MTFSLSTNTVILKFFDESKGESTHKAFAFSSMSISFLSIKIVLKNVVIPIILKKILIPDFSDAQNSISIN